MRPVSELPLLTKEVADSKSGTAERPPDLSVPVGREDTACWVCGRLTSYRHCKIVCSNCGFTRDCSDP